MSRKIILIGGDEIEETDKGTYESPLLLKVFENHGIEKITIIFSPDEESGEKREERKKESYEKYAQVFSKIVSTVPQAIYLGETDLSEEDFDKIKHADLIFFSGGDQIKVMEALTEDFIKALHKRFEADHIIIAGTSAGAMIMCKNIIAEGGNEAAQADNKIDMMRGLGLLPDFIIDTHFIERGRFARLAQVVKKNRRCYGIGVETNTALSIDHRHVIKNYGKGTVTIMDGGNIPTCEDSPSKECIFNLKVHLIVGDCSLDLNTLKELSFRS